MNLVKLLATLVGEAGQSLHARTSVARCFLVALSGLPQDRLDELSTIPNDTDGDLFFTVTHPFHPLSGQTFPLLAQRFAWGEPRMFFLDPVSRHIRSLPIAWTSLAPSDPFVLLAAGRAILGLTDLQALARLLGDLEKPTQEVPQ